MADIELRNKTDLEFTDISDEKERCYVFVVNEKPIKILIENPQWLNVSKSGGHRILDKDEICFYIPSGWLALGWKVKEGKPHFVK